MAANDQCQQSRRYRELLRLVANSPCADTLQCPRNSYPWAPRRNKVCARLKDSVELPSDYVGVVYVPWDAAGAWKMELAKEMHAAGYDIDFNKVIKGR